MEMDDLISRQALLKTLNENKIEFDSDVNYFIMHAPSANQWIPCSERLPQHYFDVLITVKEKYEYEKEYRYHTDIAEHLEGDDWITFNDWDEGQEVIITAWMPLPEPWKGEEE